MKTVKIPNHLPKPFSSHPGHGNAAKTVQSFQAVADRTRNVFPADAQQTRLDHAATKNH